jgi:hypothetical protein
MTIEPSTRPGSIASSIRCGLLSAFLLSSTLCPGGLLQEFTEANRLYEQGRYAESAATYESILASGQSSAALHFNAANARFRNNELGRAIVHYHRAQQLAPRDPDIRANLQFARQSVPGTSSVRPPAWTIPLHRLALNEWSALTAAAYWIFTSLMILHAWRPSRRRRLRPWALLMGLTSLLLCLGTAVVWFHQQHRPLAIVVVPETPVHYGPLDVSPIHFTARDGTELAATDFQPGWVQVTDAAHRTGWAPRTHVEILHR